ISVRLQCNINFSRQSIRQQTKRLDDVISRFIPRCTRLNLVGKDANEWSAQLSGEFSMLQSKIHLCTSLALIRGMKSARSINATNFQVSIFKLRSSCTQVAGHEFGPT